MNGPLIVLGLTALAFFLLGYGVGATDLSEEQKKIK